MNEIEKQVVSMEFDNKNFEKNVNTSISTLDKLKIGLSTLASSTGGVAAIASQVKGITFDPINAGVQMGIGKVMALTAALTGVVNITDALYQKVTSTVKALSVDQITAGFSKYESKTASVQTIMSAVRKEGETDEEVMSRVEEQLEKLNWFTDETSYNFTDMVSNIGKFTSQGIDLEKSVTAMQGIATWAAKSGQGTAEASRAMYNLSQSMGMGAVKLQDWKSIENANMATKEFKEQAMEAAVAAGTLKKQGDKLFAGNTEVSVQNFSQTLSEGWFSSDVLLTVLNNYGKYADMVHDMQEDNETAAETMARMKEEGLEAGNELAASAFKAAQEAKTFTEAIDATKDAVSTAFLNIFENLFGNYLEAKELWTDFANLLYDAFAAPIVAVSDLTKQWKELGGREKLLKSITRIIESLSSVFEKFSEVGNKVFGSIENKLPLLNRIGDDINRVSIFFQHFIDNLVSNEKVWENLERFLFGIKRVIDFLKISLGKLMDKAFAPLLVNILPKGIESVSELAGVFGDFLKDIADKAIALDPVSKGIELIVTGITHLIEKIKEIADISQTGPFKKAAELKDKIAAANRGISMQAFDAAIDPLKRFKEVFGKVGDFIGRVAANIGPIFASIWNASKSFFNWIITLFKGIGPALEKAGDFIKKAIDKIALFMDTFVEATKNSDKNAFDLIAELIAGGIKYLLDKLKGVDLDRLNAWLEAIERILGLVIEIIAIYSFIIDGMPDIASVELPFSGLFDSLGEAVEKVGKAQKTEATAKLVQALANAIVEIAAALLMVSFIDSDKLLSSALALSAMSVVFTIIVGALTTLLQSLISGSGGGTSKTGFVLDLISSFTGTGVDSDPISKRLKALAIFLMSIGGAILLLTASLYVISKIDWKDALEGFITIVGLMASLVGMAYAMKGIDDAWKLIALSAGFILISSAVNVIALAVAKLSNTKNVTDGLIAVMDILATFVALAYALSKVQNIGKILGVSAAILIMSVAVGKISKAVARMARLETDKMYAAVGMISAIMGYMVILAAIASAMSNASTILAVSASMVIISFAILNIAKVVEDITKINDPLLVTKTLFQLGGMALGLIGLVAALVGLSKLLTNATTNKLDMSKVTALLVISGVLVTLVIPIIAISKALGELAVISSNGGDLLSAASAIGIVFTAMVMILGMASNFKAGQIGSILGVALAIDMLAVALMAISPALAQLSNVDIGSLALVIGTIGAVMFLVIEALNLAGGTDQLIKAVGVLDLFSLAILMMAGAMLLAAAAIKVFVDQIVRISEVGPEAWQNLVDNLFNTIVTYFTAFVPHFVKAVDNLISTVVAQILNHAADITNAITALLNAVISSVIAVLRGNIPALLSAMEVLLLYLLPFITDSFNPFIYAVTKDITEYALKLLNEYVPKINEHLENATWDLFLRILKLLNKGVPMLNEELANEGLNLFMWLDWLIQGVTRIIVVGTINILRTIRDHITEIVSLMVEVATLAVYGLIDGLIAVIPELYERTVILLEDLLDLIDRVLDANWDQITETLEKLANKTIDVANKWVVKESEVGGKLYEIVGNLFKGLMKAAWKHATTSVYSPIGLGQWIGEKIGQGLCDKLKIQSPSKVFEKYGHYVIEGFGIGIQKGAEFLSPIVSDIANIVQTDFTNSFGSIGDIGQNLFNGLAEGLNSNFAGMDFASLLGDFTNLNPTITPTLDLSEIQKGTMGLDSMFASQQIDGFVNFSKYNGADSVTTTESMNAMMDKFKNYMDIQSYNNAQPTDINIVLEGDAKKMLKVLSTENVKQTKATGVNKLAEA